MALKVYEDIEKTKVPVPPATDEFSVNFTDKESEDLTKDKLSQIQASARAKRLEAELKANWEFRFNDVKGQTEFRNANTQQAFRPLSDYDLNSMIRDLRNRGITGASRETVKMLIKSDFCPKVNPIIDYFTSIKSGNLDYISKLADTITCVNGDLWPKYLRKWLIAVVAQAVNTDMSNCKNHTCLVLCGAQGVGKTTWLNWLCPPELQSYMISPGKLDPDNKEAMMYLAEYFLINIDEHLKTLNKMYENSLKELITKPSVKYRKPYDAIITEYPHRASFMGSVNGNDFLMDDTGSRRFLPFEVASINHAALAKIKPQDVWFQAYRAYVNGERYWFDQDEINELTVNNEQFHVVTPEMELILEYFEPCSFDTATHYYTTTRVLVYLEECTRQKLKKKNISAALKKIGFEYEQKRTDNLRTWFWAVKQKTDIYENHKRKAENQF